jgi:hypothetical protein
MFFRLRRASRHWLARPDFARILATPPVHTIDDGTIILSQVQKRDLLMFLVAAKSFAYHAGFGRFHVLDDGSLTPQHHALLREHIPGIAISGLRDIAAEAGPAGGIFWERLASVVKLAESRYVIQLDSDTVTLGPVDEVKECIRTNRSFALMAGRTSAIRSLAGAAAASRENSGNHIQLAAEKRLDEIDPAMGASYATATAAFAGFAPSRERAARMESFSRAMEKILGTRWTEWGSDQVASNFLVGNDPDAVLLPYRRYRNFGGDSLADDCAFVHFFGTYRYDQGTYRQKARVTAAALNRHLPSQPVPSAIAAE